MINHGNKAKSGWIFFAGCLLVLGLILSRPEHIQSSAANSGDAVEEAAGQWDQLFALGIRVIESDLKGTVKWQGTWNTLLTPEEGAGALASRLGFSEIGISRVQDHAVYDAAGSERGIDSKLTVTPVKDGQYYVVLRMEGQGKDNLEGIGALQSRYGDILADEGVEIHWNGALQGESSLSENHADREGMQNSLEETVRVMEIDASRELNLNPVENYTDEKTISRTYTVPEMPISVLSGGHQVALQFAAHLSTIAGKGEISIGSPLLTVEY